VLLGFLSLSASMRSPSVRASGLEHSIRTLQHIAPLTLPQLNPVPATAMAQTRERQWTRLFIESWVTLSVLVLLGLLASAVQVYWRRRRWTLRLVGSHCVGITADVGPAVVGLLHPSIAVPRWVLERSIPEQQLILDHEASHLLARDPLLLTGALIGLLLVPWNPLLWWQLRRLRHAIEVDCDARVLGAGHSATLYGEALIEVGQRRSRFVGAVAAMSESRSLLEERIEIMSSRLHRPLRYGFGFAACCILALSAAVAATQVGVPNAAGGRQEIAVDTATLDRYVGTYQLASTTLLNVTRQGTQLIAQITGQPALPIYAQTPTEFFWKVVYAQVSFVVPDTGPATSAIIHQNGRDISATRIDETTAQTLQQQFAERIANQQPQPGSEAALRNSINALQAGAPNYADMSPLLQQVTRQQLPVIEAFLKKLGVVQSVEYKGVADNGADKYVVTHQSGKQSQWLIELGADGKISALAVSPVF
jgi:hypothetical protein